MVWWNGCIIISKLFKLYERSQVWSEQHLPMLTTVIKNALVLMNAVKLGYTTIQLKEDGDMMRLWRLNAVSVEVEY